MERQGAKQAKGLSEPTSRADELAHAVIGAAIEVHKELGPGFPESVYEAALCIELNRRKIEFARQPIIEVRFRGITVGSGRLDLWLEKTVVVELKAVESIAPVHQAQVLAYLRATSCKLGLLFNFNVRTLKQGIHRIVNPYL